MLTIIRGLPGSGKTHMAQRIAHATRALHFETDHYFESDTGEYKFDPAKLKKAHTWCQQRTKQALKLGWSCVVSNTFTQRWELSPYIDMAKEFGILYEILTATGKWTSIHYVPTATIERMRARWEDI